MTPRALCLPLVLLASSALPARSADEVLSVEQFLATKKRWANFAAIKAKITIEGRLASYSKGGMRLRELPLSMLPEAGRRLPDLDEARNVEATVRLVPKGKRFSLVVVSVKPRPSDEATFKAMLLQLPVNDPAPWYRAARWAARRAEFYHDDGLKTQARAAGARGVQIERGGLRAGDAAGRLKLAETVRARRLPESLARELVHEAYRIRWAAHRSTGRPLLSTLRTGMKRDLPGCETVLKRLPAGLYKKYRTSPLTVYRQADKKQRAVLERLFYIDVLLAEIERDAKDDGSNGSAIAGQIEKRVPERKDLAERYRQREQDYRFSHVGESTRAAAIELAEKFRKRNDERRATETLKNWLAAQQPGARTAGADALVALADDYLRLLKDRRQAVALLREAHERSPQSEAVASRMRELGYVLQKDRWVARDNVRGRPPDPLERARKEGRVLKGMTAAQVRGAMSAAPASIARAVSSRTITEVWVFHSTTGGRVAVYFQRRRTEPRSAARVVLVSEVTATP